MVVVVTAGRRLGFLGQVGDEALGREQETSYRSGVDNRRAGYLGRIYHASGDEVLVFTRGHVVTVASFVLQQDFLNNQGTFDARVETKRAERLFNRLTDDLGANLFVAFEVIDHGVNGFDRAEQGNATTARVACKASSTRSFFSFNSVSVAAPT